jgi:tetratricopeptide (TPR) repeat protein
MQGNDLLKEAETLTDSGKRLPLVKETVEKYELAIKDLEVAINLAPAYQPARRHRGNALVGVYRALQLVDLSISTVLDRAIADLYDAVALDETSMTAHTSLGGALLLKGQHSDALFHFTRAIQINPKSAAGYHGRCQTHLRMNDFENALADAKAAAELNSDMGGNPCLKS